MIHEFALVSRNHQVCRRVHANRHIGEEPAEQCALVNHPVKEFLVAYSVNVLACIAAGNTERQLMVAQDFHSLSNLLEGAFAAAGIRRSLCALNADSRNEVADAQHIFCKLVVNQSRVCEAEEHTVVVLLAQFNDVIFTNQRFTAGVDVHVGTHGNALIDDVINLVKRQVQLVAVLSSPAASAVQVAGAGRIQQNCPRHVAAVLFTDNILTLTANQSSVDNEVGEDGLQHVQVNVGVQLFDKFKPVVVRVIDNAVEHGALALVHIILIEFVNHVEQFGDIFLRVLTQVAKGFLNTKFSKFVL